MPRGDEIEGRIGRGEAGGVEHAGQAPLGGQQVRGDELAEVLVILNGVRAARRQPGILLGDAGGSTTRAREVAEGPAARR